MTTKELIDQAISLPVEERARLADSLLCSFNAPESAVDCAWVSVAQRRLDELRSGQGAPVPGNEVFAKVWQRFQR